MALALPVAACDAVGIATPGQDAELMTVVLDAPGDGVTEWRGDAGDFEDHPYQPEGLVIDVAYPRFEGAEPFAEGLAARVDQEVHDYRGASRDPASLEIEWEVVAAGDGALGVRLVRTEEDFHGVRQGYDTYWYDVPTGRTAYSTELLADDAALEELNGFVREALADDPDVDVEGLHPVVRTYDSMGFNADGDLVVEFDDGHLSPVVEGHTPTSEPGRKAAVMPFEEASALLSDLGERAREASLAEEPVLAVEGPSPESDSDAGSGSDPGIPGVVEDASADVDCSKVDCIALTFDDGPSETTPRLLDMLAEEEVTVSFFLNGNPALTRPSVLRRAYAEGHEVASHNHLHEHMPEHFSDEELDHQVAAVSAMVRRQTGHTVELFRPPFGDSSPEVLEEIGRQGMAEILWSQDSEDWTGLSSREIVENVVDEAEPGAVVLLHDTIEPTLEAVPEILDQLRGQGYEFVSVSRLHDPEPGKSYPPGGLGEPVSS